MGSPRLRYRARARFVLDLSISLDADGALINETYRGQDGQLASRTVSELCHIFPDTLGNRSFEGTLRQFVVVGSR